MNFVYACFSCEQNTISKKYIAAFNHYEDVMSNKERRQRRITGRGSRELKKSAAPERDTGGQKHQDGHESDSGIINAAYSQ